MITTPQVWDETRDLPGQQGEVIYLENGNILTYFGTVINGEEVAFARISDSFGNEVVAPFLLSIFFESTSGLGESLEDVIALPGGGFAVLTSLPQSNTNELVLDIYNSAGNLINNFNLNADLDNSDTYTVLNANLTVSADGDIQISATAILPDFLNPEIIGWTLDANNNISAPYVVDNNGQIGFDPNGEDPRVIDAVALDSGRIASLIVERDFFIPASRATIDIVFTDADGGNPFVLELTGPNGNTFGNGGIDILSPPSITYIGNGNLVVLYRTDSSAGGDGNWYVARFDGTTFNGNPLTDTDLLDTGSQSQANIQPTLTALENSNGTPNGEYLVSFIDEANNEIFIQRYDSNHNRIGSAVEIDIEANSEYSIELLDGNRFMVMFENPNGDAQQIIYTYDDESGLFDAAGNYLGTTGNDNVLGMAGVPGYYLSAGDDIITEANFEDGVIVDMGADDDIFFASLGNNADYANNVTIDGGSGLDFYLAGSANSTQNITVDFETGGVITVDGISGTRTITNIEGFISGSGDDDIRADDNESRLSGGAGDDFLSGRGGDDIVSGGSGDDILFGGNEEDEVNGNADDDTIIGGRGDDDLNGGTGNDTFYQWNHGPSGVGFTDTIDGGDDFDTIIMRIYDADGPQNFSGIDYNFNLSAQGAGSITGGNEIINFTNIELIIDGTGDATFLGSSGNDQFFGNDGDDIITGGDSLDVLIGGDDNDTFIYTDTSDLFGGSTTFQGAVLLSEVIDGGAGTDRIVVDIADGDELELNEVTIVSIEEIEFAQSQIQGQSNTVLLDAEQVTTGSRSFASNLNIIGSNGQGGFADRISISMADITELDLSQWTFENWGRDNQIIEIIGDADDEVITGSSQDDFLIGGLGADIINGGDGNDTVSYQRSTEGIKVFNSDRSGSGGEAEGDRLINVENIVGSNFADEIILDSDTAIDNVVNSGGGDDRIRDRNDGENTYNTGAGEDRVFGGGDIDIIDGGSESDDLFGGRGNDIIEGGAGNFRDTLFGGANDDILNGGDGNDALRGNTGEDTLNGGGGTDNLQGGNQSDILNGGSGIDTLDGGSGNDILNGGADNDRLTGGSSNDLFIFENGSGTDRITDFNFGAGDQIDLTDFGLADFDAVTALATEVNGDVRIQLDADDRLILLDTTLASLDANDFILS